MKPELFRKRTVLLVGMNVLVCKCMLDLYSEITSAQVIQQQVDIEVKSVGAEIAPEKTILPDKDKTGEINAVAKLEVAFVKAITKRQILPVFRLPVESSQVLALRACPGEYEPTSFVATPLQGDMTIQVKPTDLKGPAGIIPNSAVDIYAVKRWYQAGDN